MKRGLLSLIIFIALVSTVRGGTSGDWLVYLPSIHSPFVPRVLNPSFESGEPPGKCLIWHYEQPFPQTTCNDEQDVPTSWYLVAYNEYPCPCQKFEPPCDADFRTRLPEVRLIDKWTYPQSVCHLDYSVMGFTFWGCVRYALTQMIPIEPQYVFIARAEAITWGEGQRVRICLGAICSDWTSSPQACTMLETPPMVPDLAKIISSKAELRLECWSDWPWQNNNCWFDHVSVELVGQTGR